jgi:hypothetical protein
LLENLKKKVNNFSVLDNHGQLVGIVKDLIVGEARQLNFVVSRLVDEQSLENGLFLLPSKLIQRIDAETKSIILDLDKLETQGMPEYTQRETVGMNISESYLEPEATIDSNIHPEQVVYRDAEEEIIRLLGERIIVDRAKRKIGEVIVRKQIETRMIQVPVRCEKLIVEQVSPEHKQLAEIDLDHEVIDNSRLTTQQMADVSSFDDGLTVSGEFNSPKIASLLLNAIALERESGCKKVKVTILVEDEEHQRKYQDWFQRSSLKQ